MDLGGGGGRLKKEEWISDIGRIDWVAAAAVQQAAAAAAAATSCSGGTPPLLLHRCPTGCPMEAKQERLLVVTIVKLSSASASVKRFAVVVTV